MQIGVCNGMNAKDMLEAVSGKGNYFGFDLFGDGIKPAENEEHCVFTHPLKLDQVQTKLQATGATVQLFQGDSTVTVPKFVAETSEVFDLIFIDGGHDFETVLKDWLNIECLIQQHTVVMFDDYFTNGYLKGRGDWGITGVVNSIDENKYNVEILPYSDAYPGLDDLCLVKVTKK